MRLELASVFRGCALGRAKASDTAECGPKSSRTSITGRNPLTVATSLCEVSGQFAQPNNIKLPRRCGRGGFIFVANFVPVTYRSSTSLSRMTHSLEVTRSGSP